jgi:hypothetical protein
LCEKISFSLPRAVVCFERNIWWGEHSPFGKNQHFGAEISMIK